MLTQETSIDFIRHGEPMGGRMYRGKIDHPLSKKGWQQMHDAINKYPTGACCDETTSQWDLIVTSPLIRCFAFAEVLSQQLNLPLVTINELTEISFGEWEGKTPDEIKATDSELFYKFHEDPVENRPPGAESLINFSARIIDSLLTLIKAYPNKRILLVTHAGIMRSIIIHVLKAPLKNRQSIRFPYAGMLRLYAKGEQLRLECL